MKVFKTTRLKHTELTFEAKWVFGDLISDLLRGGEWSDRDWCVKGWSKRELVELIRHEVRKEIVHHEVSELVNKESANEADKS